MNLTQAQQNTMAAITSKIMAGQSLTSREVIYCNVCWPHYYDFGGSKDQERTGKWLRK